MSVMKTRIKVMQCKRSTCEGDNNGCSSSRCGEKRRWVTWTIGTFYKIFGYMPR